MLQSHSFSDLLEALPRLHQHHSPQSSVYRLLRGVARTCVEAHFSADSEQRAQVGPLGELAFPYVRMGAIDSLDLFGLDELILFSFYWTNRQRYRKVLDLGANIGLHSLVLARCGYQVRSYEPDPVHFRLLNENLRRNDVRTVDAINAAISAEDGTLEFVRVLGNTTGSHLAGAKENPYGELDRFPVEVQAFAPRMAWADLIKMDVEGHEAAILCTTSRSDWASIDAVVEIGSVRNAELVFSHFEQIGVNLFAQNQNWNRVRSLEDMPTGYRDGSLFISCRGSMPWGEA